MKKFMAMLLVFLMLMGNFASYADDIDILDDVEIETESIEEPVEEIELLLDEDILEEVDLLGQEDVLYSLQDEEIVSNSFDQEIAANSDDIISYEEAVQRFEPSQDKYPGIFVWPIKNVEPKTGINSWAGMRNGDLIEQQYGYKHASWTHHGTDIKASDGTPIRASASGTAYASAESGCGIYVVIAHGNGWYTEYQHLSSVAKEDPEKGTTEIKWNGITENIQAGQIIGYAGGTGGGQYADGTGSDHTYGAHLHYEIVYDPAGSVSPKEYMRNTYNHTEYVNVRWSDGIVYYNADFQIPLSWKICSPKYQDYVREPAEIIPISSIDLGQKSYTLNLSVDKSFQVPVKIQPDNAILKTLSWSSDNSAVATVDENGIVKPVSVGETTIHCAAQDGSGVTASCKVTVTNFKLNKGELDVYVGQTYTLNGTVGKTKVTCSFKSSNPKVVSVDKKGKITAKSVKKTTKVTITATAPKKQGTATCVVTVHPKPKKLTFKQGKTKTLNVGDTLDLSIDNLPKDALSIVVWSTSHKKVATVSKAGKVKAIGEGVATIEAEVLGIDATIKITVTDPYKPTGISISAPSKTVRMGETLQLTTALKPKTAQSDISWKSSNTKIAKVSKKGVVTPVKTGKVTITATAAKKSPKGKTVSAKIEITVKKSNAPTSISVGTKKKTMYPGEKWSLDYKIKPTDAKATFTFSSSDADVASISKKGVIKALKKGTTTITVKTQNNLTATCKVTVKSKPTIQLDKENLTLNVGDQYYLTVFVSGGTSGKKFNFSSSNTRVATVDKNAVITAVGIGEAVITVSMDNDDVATCNVTVNDPNTVTEFRIEEPETISLRVGDTYKISTVIKPESAHPDILWSISKDGILDEWWTAYACIASDGTITALKEGEKIVYARIKRDGMDDLVRSVRLKIESSGSTTQLYEDGALRVLGVINNHREENDVAMVTIDGSLCEMARQQLDQIISGGGNTISDSYSWILHSDLPYSADDIYISLNMRVELKQEAKDICFDPSKKYVGIAVGFSEPWWGYALAIFK